MIAANEQSAAIIARLSTDFAQMIGTNECQRDNVTNSRRDDVVWIVDRQGEIRGAPAEDAETAPAS